MNLHKHAQRKKGLLKAKPSGQDIKEPKIYLAAPYTHADASIRQERALQVSQLAGVYLARGLLVYSPLSHGVAICNCVNLPLDFEFWAKHCLSFIKAWATELHVFTLPGWQESLGVQAEIKLAKELGLPVRYIAPAA